MIESPLLQEEEYGIPFTAEIRVRNLEESLGFYVDKLGFQVVRSDKPNKFALVRLGDAYLMILEKSIEGEKGLGFFFRLSVPDVLDFYRQVKDRGAKTLGEPEKRYWGGPRFYVEDPDGFKIQIIPSTSNQTQQQ